jgi:hypothetical protein
LLADALGGSDVEVTLKFPPPLDRDLTIEADSESARLRDGDKVVGEATRRSVDLDVPRPPSLDQAQEAMVRYAGQANHIFPTCFVCGPERTPGDGLRIFPGAACGNQVAAAWIPDPSLLDADGCLATEFIWAALDCPGFSAVEAAARPAVLGRFAVHIADRPIGPQTLIVTGWPILAYGAATWITLRASSAEQGAP